MLEEYLHFNPIFFEKEVRGRAARQYNGFLTYQEEEISLLFGLNPLSSDPDQKREIELRFFHVYDHFQRWCERDTHLLVAERKGIHSLSRANSLHEAYLAEIIAAESLDRDSLQKYASSRTIAHLHRLARPLEQMYGRKYDPRLDSRDEEMRVSYEGLQNNICKAFSKDFLVYLAKKPTKEATEVWHQVRETVGYEGEGVFFFWTVAPYVHHCQKQAGISQEESIDRIYSWIKRSNAGTFFNAQYLVRGEYAILAPDQRMPSHFQAHLVARYFLSCS